MKTAVSEINAEFAAVESPVPVGDIVNETVAAASALGTLNSKPTEPYESDAVGGALRTAIATTLELSDAHLALAAYLDLHDDTSEIAYNASMATHDHAITLSNQLVTPLLAEEPYESRRSTSPSPSISA